MKKITGILLLLCLTAPFMLMYTSLQFEKRKLRKQIKRSMIAGIDRKELLLLKFTDAEVERQLRWEHGKEFEYRGGMYDIVERFVKGDTTFYWCWPDHKETRLNRQLAEMLNRALQNDPQNNETQKKISAFFKTPFNVSLFEWKIYPPEFSEKFNPFCFFIITEFLLPPPVPPPIMI